MDLVALCYQLAAKLPRAELFGLASQIRRAAVSVPANIAEGHGRDHLGEYLHHLSIAYGSLMELETHLQIAVRVDHVAQEEIDPILLAGCEVGRMLNGLVRSLKQRRPDI